MQREPGGGGEGQRLKRRSRRIRYSSIAARAGADDARRLIPSRAIHHQQRELGLTGDDRVGVARWAPQAGRLGEQGRRLARRRPSAGVPRRGGRVRHLATGSTRARRRRRALRRPVIMSGPSAHITARSMACADPNDAVPSSGVCSHELAVGDRGPPLRVRGVPGQHGDPACQDGQRRMAFDAGISQRGEPVLHGRDLAGAVGGQDQGRHELDAAIPFVRVQQVVDRQLRGSVRFVPIGRSQVQLGDRSRARCAAAQRAGTPDTGRGSDTTRVAGPSGSRRGSWLPGSAVAPGAAIPRAAHRRADRES